MFILSTQKWGVAIFVLYFVQCASGAVIHWLKPARHFHRPPQNYLHAVVGILIIALSLYQVRSGFRTEWPKKSGLGKLSNAVNIVWYVWVVVS